MCSTVALDGDDDDDDDEVNTLDRTLDGTFNKTARMA